MRDGFIIYPEGMEKIRNAGLDARVEALKKSEDGLPFLGGFVWEEDIKQSVQDLKERGFYKHLPADFADTYKKTLTALFKNPDKFNWATQRQATCGRDACELEDLVLFTGEIASLVLEPNELWDYQRFGFSSPTELVGVVSAYIDEQSRGEPLHKGYEWTGNRDGAKILTEITGDMNADLRISQKDITPYETTDPFGNRTTFRPIGKPDRTMVCAYHSTEPELVVAVLKYIDQQKIPSKILENNAAGLIAWAESLNQRIGNCAEHIFGTTANEFLSFANYTTPIPILNNRNETKEQSHDWLTTISDGAYGVYITAEGYLALAYEERSNGRQPRKEIQVNFKPDDVDHVLKGLIYQSAAALGRTSARALIDLVAYRFSPQFDKDRQEFKA